MHGDTSKDWITVIISFIEILCQFLETTRSAPWQFLGKLICLVSLAAVRLSLIDNDVWSIDTEIPKKKSMQKEGTCIHGR